MSIIKPVINVLTYILDNDPDYLLLIEKVLKEANQDGCHLFSDVNLFLEAIDSDSNVCIVDYSLGHDLNGLDIMKKILSKNHMSYVIMVSNQTDIDVVTEFYNCDGYRYINKTGEGFSRKLVAALVGAKAKIQKRLDDHFELIERFNKTEETFKDARDTISHISVGVIP